jgi:hypothetical protein
MPPGYIPRYHSISDHEVKIRKNQHINIWTRVLAFRVSESQHTEASPPCRLMVIVSLSISCGFTRFAGIIKTLEKLIRAEGEILCRKLLKRE